VRISAQRLSHGRRVHARLGLGAGWCGWRCARRRHLLQRPAEQRKAPHSQRPPANGCPCQRYVEDLRHHGPGNDKTDTYGYVSWIDPRRI
jgi:hypothetical protein